VVLTLLLAFVLRIRWLVALVSFGITMAASLAWKSLGYEWMVAWGKYLYKPVLAGGLWRQSATEEEITGLIVFWLLPLALAYATAVARIAKIKRGQRI
jgi:hypothetical protein